jgi:hypothetical protein
LQIRFEGFKTPRFNNPGGNVSNLQLTLGRSAGLQPCHAGVGSPKGLRYEREYN